MHSGIYWTLCWWLQSLGPPHQPGWVLCGWPRSGPGTLGATLSAWLEGIKWLCCKMVYGVQEV